MRCAPAATRAGIITRRVNFVSFLEIDKNDGVANMKAFHDPGQVGAQPMTAIGSSSDAIQPNLPTKVQSNAKSKISSFQRVANTSFRSASRMFFATNSASSKVIGLNFKLTCLPAHVDRRNGARPNSG
jgi:hypothetical protein